MISMCGNSSDDIDVREAMIGEIRQEYFQAKPPLQIKGLEQLQLQGDRIISPSFRNIFEVTVGQTKHQPPIQYRIAFVKHVIKQLEFAATDNPREEDDEEDISMWYEALESFSSLETHSEPFYRLYDIGTEIVVKIYENEAAFVAEGTTGLVTWEASIELAKWLNSSNHVVQNSAWILELGCGCGFLGVGALRIFPNLSKYIASDGHPIALQKTKLNLEANFGSSKSDIIQTELIDWEKDEDKFQTIVISLTEKLGPGVLLGADITFDPIRIPSLVKLIDIFLETSKLSVAFLSCTIRNESTMKVLEAHLEADSNRTVKPKHKWKNGVIFDITRNPEI